MISSPLIKVIKTSPMKHYTLTAKRCHSAALESVQTVKCDPVFRLMGDDEEITCVVGVLKRFSMGI
mgnify:CR=1 FL=1